MTIDFDRMIDRRNTDSLKWSGSRGNQTIPMWVADMDFAAPECVLRAVRQRVDQGVFGYPVVTEQVTRAVVTWAASHYQWRIEPEWLVWLPGLVSGVPAAPTQAGR
jgi:cystathionine beta-lyase